MPYIITGSVTFGSQANRDAAITRVNTALSGYSLTAYATQFPAGLNTPTTTTITFSYKDGEDGGTAGTVGNALLSALVSVNRHTSGWVSVNKV